MALMRLICLMCLMPHTKFLLALGAPVAPGAVQALLARAFRRNCRRLAAPTYGALGTAQSQHCLLHCIITVTPSSLSLSLHRERHPLLHALPLHNCLRRLGHKE